MALKIDTPGSIPSSSLSRFLYLDKELGYDMSAFVKDKLKKAKEAIAKKNFEAARDAAQGVLEYEPENYTAYAYIAHISQT